MPFLVVPLRHKQILMEQKRPARHGELEKVPVVLVNIFSAFDSN